LARGGLWLGLLLSPASGPARGPPGLASVTPARRLKRNALTLDVPEADVGGQRLGRRGSRVDGDQRDQKGDQPSPGGEPGDVAPADPGEGHRG
jgi:hypothetical protein